MKSKRLIFIQNSWRILDNPLLDLPNDKMENCLIGCIDVNWHKQVNGFRARSELYEQFAIESAKLFQAQLKKEFNIDCQLYHETPDKIITEILRFEPSISILRIEAPIAHNENLIIEKIKKTFPKINIEIIWQNALYHPDELAFQKQDYHRSFTQWRKKLESKSIIVTTSDFNFSKSIWQNVPFSLDFPALEADAFQQETSNTIFKPGEKAALARVDYYLHQSDLIQNYKQTRDQLLGTDFSSKFSPWLAHGTISPRTIYKEIEQYEETKITNQSTYWLKFELLWREFFRHAMSFEKKNFFLLSGIQHHATSNNKSDDLFSAWCNGKTASDFINANMKELNQTGYMSNRGRQNVASYLIHELQLDWRLGAAYFESKLLDYDVSSNWCNWAYLAGVGNDPSSRKFNIKKQQAIYDPNGEYIKVWLAK